MEGKGGTDIISLNFDMQAQDIEDNSSNQANKEIGGTSVEEDLSVDFSLVSVIGENDVKMFHNFSWADGSPPEEN